MGFDGGFCSMSPLRWFHAVLALIALYSLSLTVNCPAEAFKSANPGAGSVALTGAWQFQTGDNPAWAEPSLDDCWRG